MKIAILGTRGIPNNHGGFEQFAEYLSQFFVNHGHEVYVYNSNTHPFKESSWRGVNILHKYDPENKIGTAGQFIYDLNCILDSRRRNFDIILQLGYTSSSIWHWLMPRKSLIVTNMDGLEWKRTKYKPAVRKFLKYAEKLGANYSDYLIADSLGIQEHLKKTYQKDSEYIAYGAEPFMDPVEAVITEYGVQKYDYNLLIARLEPENNVETILDGVVKSSNDQPFLVIGKHETTFGEYLKGKFKDSRNIRFLGGIYNIDHLNNLRYWSNLYFHGHSVGGTNPSLLEAMASNTLIVAHDNVFNKSILGIDAFYFQNTKDVKEFMEISKKEHIIFIKNNRAKIENNFSWELVNNKYLLYLEKCLKNKIIFNGGKS